jgi:hypothetical protein
MLAFAIVVTSCTTTGGQAADGSTTSAPLRIVEYGIYEADQAGSTPNPDTPMGSTLKFENIRLLEKTDDVPVVRGTIFGIMIQYDDPNRVSIQIVRRLVHPEFYDPEMKKTTTEFSWKKTIRSGKASFWAYELEEDFEMISGTWVFEVWSDGELACSQAFNLHQP